MVSHHRQRADALSSDKGSITRDDVARRAGVSPATVSYVINNGPRPVSPETRARVLEAIRETGYQPNAIARSLRRQKTSTLGLVIPDTNNPYFVEVARGVETVAFEHGFKVVLCHSNYDSDREVQYMDLLGAERAAGVIWIPSTESSAPAERLIEHQVPLVILDRTVNGVRSPSVVADNFRGGYLATQHLISLHHRRIGLIVRPVVLSHSEERARGYAAALLEHDLPVEEKLIVPGGFRLENGHAAACSLLGLDPPPTAIFAYNDIMAIGALRAAYQRGLRVPGDLSIVGFDDIPEAAFTCPSLTTISQPKSEMGRRGAELLLALIGGQSSSSDAQPPLGVYLVVRESTGPAPQG
ncbi:MAG: LacI family DNA-binding transcriptional regulator [Chloroflexi bacterium]|jgi:LacI family transcriptional regulator|nr:LacI family DNA-binding transcriptional regulator [Chloroflexota bacterium]